MKIKIISYGAIGDVIPFKGLALALQNAGHSVQMLSHDIFKEAFVTSGIDYKSIGPHLSLEKFNTILDDLDKIKNPLKSLIYFTEKSIIADSQQWYVDCLEALKDADLAILHAVDIPGQEAAIKRGVPWITANFFPGGLKTSFEAPVPFPTISKPLNKFFWSITSLICKCVYDPLFNRFILSVNGKKRKNIALKSTYSPELHLMAVSPALCNIYPDILPNIKFTGAWLDNHEEVNNSTLQEFIQKGTPPILLSFSSMGGSSGPETANVLIDMFKRNKQRVIIQKGWSGMYTESALDNILFVDYVPHAYLLKHVSCIIHHGGAGITQRACYEGIPSIIIPHISDQFYWGRLLHQKNLSPPPLPRKDLTVKKLEKLINEVQKNPKYKVNLAKMSQLMKQENGYNKSVELILDFAKKKGLVNPA